MKRTVYVNATYLTYIVRLVCVTLVDLQINFRRVVVENLSFSQNPIIQCLLLSGNNNVNYVLDGNL